MLHLVDRWSDRGGAHRHLQGVLRVLEQAGHTVAVAAGELEAPARPGLFRVPGLECRTRADADLAPLVADFRPDVVHLHTVVNPAVLEWASRVPAVVTVQDHRYFCPAQGKWTRRGEECREALEASLCAGCFDDDAYFREVLALTQARLLAVGRLQVVTLSRYMAGELEQAGVSAARLTVIPPFGDLPPVGPALGRGAGHVAILGRLTESKGVRDAVAAWRRAETGLPLVAAGTGPLRPWLEAEGVRVTGWLDASALAAFLSATRAVLLTPRWQEPFGIAGLEALQAGVPVVAWRSGGIPEWHPGPLAAWGDVAGVADRLRATLREGDVPEAVRAGLRRRFDPGLAAQSLVEVYRRAVGLP